MKQSVGAAARFRSSIHFSEKDLPLLKMNLYSDGGAPLLIVDKAAAELPLAKSRQIVDEREAPPPAEEKPEIVDTPKADTPKDDPAASRILKEAQRLLRARFRVKAHAKFKEIVEKYPDTTAAKEAQKAIDKLSDQADGAMHSGELTPDLDIPLDSLR